MNTITQRDRRAIQFSLFDSSGIGLEIGPAHNPLVPKREGFQVEILDYAEANYLRAKWADNPTVDPSGIELVDYPTNGRPMLEIVPHRSHYDYIVASHVIEHVPDMLGFLQECQALLKPSGRLVLAVPDKRFCFDVLRPVSTIGQVLQAALEHRTRNLPGVAFDHAAYHSTLDGRGDWGQGTLGMLTLPHRLADAHRWFEVAQGLDYIDVHAWQFTPSSFRLIVLALGELGKTRLTEAAFHPTQGCEFFIAMSQDGRGCPIGRSTLARLSLFEEAAALLSLASTVC